jgi:pyruvate dehydrogenase (quinone)
MNASDVLVERLIEWGVDTVFGLPGDGINGVFEALRKQKDRIRFIHVRHEESAAFMACAYAKFTGRLGVCVATSGPGGIHLLNGLYDAKMDGSPVLAITGMQHSDLIGTFTQQDVAPDKLYVDVAVYNERVMNGAHMESVTDLAVRSALSKRGVAHLTIPVDVQVQAMKEGRSSRNPVNHTTASPAFPEHLPSQVDLEHAADILNRGKKIAFLPAEARFTLPTNWNVLRRSWARRSSKHCSVKPRFRTTAPTRRAESACLARSLRRMRWRLAIRFSSSVHRSHTLNSFLRQGR